MGEPGFCGGIRREGVGFHRGQQFLPDQIQYGLHIADACGDGDDGILQRHDDAKLSKRAIAPIAIVAAAPKLVAVPLLPVPGEIAAVGGINEVASAIHDSGMSC